MSSNYLLEQYRSAKNLSHFAIVALIFSALCEILVIFIGLGQLVSPDLVLNLDDGTPSSLWLIFQSFVALIEIPVYIFSAVMFLIWLNRAYKNLTPLQARDTEFSSGWAVGWWFIPFLNLFKPFQVVREIWYESDPIIDTEQRFLSASLRSAPTYMGIWWAFWIISNVAANITGAAFDPDDIRTVTISGYLFVISGILTCIAAFFAINVVRDITQRQDLRSSNLAIIPDQPPPAGSWGA
jgi:hypothetical protein